MKREIIEQLSWEDIQEINITATCTLRELDTCKEFPNWSSSTAGAFSEVKRRLLENAK